MPAVFSASVGSGVADLALKMAILTWADTSFTKMGGGRADGVEEEDAAGFVEGR